VTPSSKLGDDGRLISGDAPTKESFLHLAMYGEREKAGAVVHLHSTHSVAVSYLDGINPEDVLPPITAYYVMRVGKLPLVPYYAPGDKALGKAAGAARHSPCCLPIMVQVAACTAVDPSRSLETLALLCRQPPFLTVAQIEDLNKHCPSREHWIGRL
jgi:hypothetical protein